MNTLRVTRIAGEIAVLLGALILLEHAVLGPARFAALAPHPYWVPVLAMAIAYGWASGLAAAIGVSILWSIAPHAELASTTNPFDRNFALALPPLLWLGAAIAIGEVTNYRTRRTARERHKVRTLFRQQDALLADVRRLVALNHEFQVELVANQNDVALLVEQVLEIEHGDPAQAGRTLLAAIARATGSTAASVYLADGASLRLFATGAPGSAPDHLAGRLAETIAHALLPITQQDDEGRALLGGLSEVALPLRTGPHDPLVGAILFHDDPARWPARLSERAARIELAEIARWIAMSLQRRDRRADLLQPRVGELEHQR